MHHGDDAEIMAKMAEYFHQQQVDTLQRELGATGQFPEGQLNDDDEGEIRIAIGSTEGKVVMDFGKPIAWIGFTPEQARGIAELLLRQVEVIKENDRG